MKSVFRSPALYLGPLMLLSLGLDAHSGVLAKEFFDYESTLNSPNSSVGWNGEWKLHPTDDSLPIDEAGANFYGIAGTRPIALNPGVTDTGSIYIGFKIANANGGYRGFIVSLHEKGAEKVAMGQGKSKSKWGLLKSRSKEPWLESEVASRPNGEPVQMVARIDFKGEGEDKITLYVGADLSAPEPTEASPNILVLESMSLSRIDSLKIQSYLDGSRQNVSGTGVVGGTIANIVIGTTWQDVATTTPR